LTPYHFIKNNIGYRDKSEMCFIQFYLIKNRPGTTTGLTYRVGDHNKSTIFDEYNTQISSNTKFDI